MQSCGDPKMVKVEVEFLLPSDVNLTKDGFVSLIEPHEVTDDKEEFIVVSYPLTIYRMDTERKLKLDYLNNKAVNYEKLAAVKRDFNKYFEASVFDSVFTLGSKNNSDFTSYLTMPNCFLYSEKPESGSEIGEKRIFHDATELRTELATYAQKNKGKIFILYYPYHSPSGSTEEPAESVNEVESVKKPTSTSNKANVSSTSQESANSLEEYFQKLASRDIPYESKTGLKKGILSYFTNDATIVRVNNNKETLAGGNQSISSYAESLCSTHRRVVIVEKQMSDTKISKLKVKEE